MAKSKKSSAKKLYVLDTNVLIHEPESIFKFDEHSVFIPLRVLEELDNQRGQGGVDLSVLNESNIHGTLTDNIVMPNTITGNNIIDASSFANAAGIVSVIQNTGNNVLIQNSTIVNFVITP